MNPEGGPATFAGPTGTSTSVLAKSAYGNPWLFNGRAWDAELGLYHYRNRHLDPVQGRFTTRDPIGLWGDPMNLGNGYSYVGNNPWTYVDPFGLFGGPLPAEVGQAIISYSQQPMSPRVSPRTSNI